MATKTLTWTHPSAVHSVGTASLDAGDVTNDISGIGVERVILFTTAATTAIQAKDEDSTYYTHSVTNHAVAPTATAAGLIQKSVLPATWRLTQATSTSTVTVVLIKA